MQPKFKIGDILEGTHEGTFSKFEIKALTYPNFSDCYHVLIIQSSMRYIEIGYITGIPFGITHDYFRLVNLNVTDCTCPAHTLLHKGCSCGYAKANSKPRGLAAQFVKAA
jgi:hypothetical protein